MTLFAGIDGLAMLPVALPAADLSLVGFMGIRVIFMCSLRHLFIAAMALEAARHGDALGTIVVVTILTLNTPSGVLGNFKSSAVLSGRKRCEKNEARKNQE
jgi:hypothetical protein